MSSHPLLTHSISFHVPQDSRQIQSTAHSGGSAGVSSSLHVAKLAWNLKRSPFKSMVVYKGSFRVPCQFGRVYPEGPGNKNSENLHHNYNFMTTCRRSATSSDYFMPRRPLREDPKSRTAKFGFSNSYGAGRTTFRWIYIFLDLPILYYQNSWSPGADYSTLRRVYFLWIRPEI